MGLHCELHSCACWHPSGAGFKSVFLPGIDLLRAIWIRKLVNHGADATFGFVPPQVVGSVTGLSGLAAGLTSTLFTLLVGFLVDHLSYFPAFVLAATAPLLATVVVFLIRRPVEPARLAG